MDPAKLDLVFERQHLLWGGESWGIAIIRHGWLVREAYTFNVLVPTRFDVWSCTKSFTGTAWGLLFDDSRRGVLPGGLQVDLDSPAYDFIPEGHPLTDERKVQIRLRHLLTMTSGIPGESKDAFALLGYRCNCCYVVPSLDLVVARVGSGPAAWEGDALIGGIVETIV
jgi:CubicO group peptidase (beta-lactamase class C family)